MEVTEQFAEQRYQTLKYVLKQFDGCKANLSAEQQEQVISYLIKTEASVLLTDLI